MKTNEKNPVFGITGLSWRRIASVAVLPAFLVSAPLVQAEPTNFKVDDEHFSMVFEIMHIGYAPVMGMFREIEGEFVYDEETRELSSGKLIFKSNKFFYATKFQKFVRTPCRLLSRKYFC
jgi:hypothetical protein